MQAKGPPICLTYLLTHFTHTAHSTSSLSMVVRRKMSFVLFQHHIKPPAPQYTANNTKMMSRSSLLFCVTLAIAAHLTCHHEVSAFSSPSPSSRLPSTSFKGIVSTTKRVHSSYSTALLHATAPPNDIVPSLISASNNWGNVAALSFTASFAQLLGKKTLVGKLLGAPVTAMAIAFILSSVGIFPSTTSFSSSTSSSTSSTEWMTILPPGGKSS